MTAPPVLAPCRPEHVDAVVRLWRDSFEHAVGVASLHPPDDQRRWFVETLCTQTDVHVALLDDGRVAGFVASTPESVQQLYVRIGYLGRGIGTGLLDLAKRRSGGSLWLYAFARNANARRFYERSGFRVISTGFEPHWQLEDVKYLWTRAG